MALTNNLISVYHMNNDWQDSWGANHGTPTGAIFDGTDKKLGSHSGSFDSAHDDLVTVGNISGIQSLFSFSCWVKRSEIGQSNTSHIFGGVANDWAFGFTGTGALPPANRLFLSKVGVSAVMSTGTIADTTTWHHVVVTFNGTTVQFYIDNVLDSSPAYTVTFDGSIKRFGYVSANSLYGRLDEGNLWDKITSAAEVSELWNGGAGIEIGAGQPTILRGCSIPGMRQWQPNILRR